MATSRVAPRGAAARPRHTARKPAAGALERRPRRALTWGGALLLFGLAMVGIGSAESGSIVTLLGLGILVYGIHTFGRLGPEED